MPPKISIRIEFYNGIVRFLCHSTVFLSFLVISDLSNAKTRQLSYRKEDRAMRPIDGCPEKF